MLLSFQESMPQSELTLAEATSKVKLNKNLGLKRLQDDLLPNSYVV